VYIYHTHIYISVICFSDSRALACTHAPSHHDEPWTPLPALTPHMPTPVQQDTILFQSFHYISIYLSICIRITCMDYAQAIDRLPVRAHVTPQLTKHLQRMRPMPTSNTHNHVHVVFDKYECIHIYLYKVQDSYTRSSGLHLRLGRVRGQECRQGLSKRASGGKECRAGPTQSPGIQSFKALYQ
jgi:hypothetical protein